MIRFVQRRSRQVAVAAPKNPTRRVDQQPALPVEAKRVHVPVSGKIRTIGHPNEDPLYEELARAQASDLPSASTLIAVLVPVLGRPHRVAPLLESFVNATSAYDATLYLIAQRSDTEELRAIEAQGLEPILVDDEDRSWAKKINRGFAATKEPWILLAADDLAFHAGWVDKVRTLLHSHCGVIGTNDLGNASTIKGISSTHPLVRRTYAQIFGTADERGRVLHEGYDHNFPDSELVETAKARGLYTHKRDCVIEPLHPLWGKGERDQIYQLGSANWNTDQALFVARCKKFGI